VQLTHGDAFEKEPQNGYKPAKTSSPKHDLTLDLAYEVFLKGLKIYWDCIGFAAVCTRRVARLHEKLQKTRIPEETEGENENEDEGAEEDEDDDDDDGEEEENEDDLHPVIVDLTKVRTFIECDNYNRRSYQFRSPAFPGQREIVLDGIIVLEHPNRHPKDANQFQSIVSVLYYEKQRELQNFEAYDRYIRYSTLPYQFITVEPNNPKLTDQIATEIQHSGLPRLLGKNHVQANMDEGGIDKNRENVLFVAAIPANQVSTEIQSGQYSTITTEDADPTQLHVLPSLPNLTNDILACTHILEPGQTVVKRDAIPAPTLIMELIEHRKNLTNRLLAIPDGIEKNYTLGKSSGTVKGAGSTVSTNNDARKLFDEGIKELRKILIHKAQYFIDHITEKEREINAYLINEDNKQYTKENGHPLLFHKVSPTELRTTITFLPGLDYEIIHNLYVEGHLKDQYFNQYCSEEFGIPIEAFNDKPKPPDVEPEPKAKPAAGSSSSSKPSKSSKAS